MYTGNYIGKNDPSLGLTQNIQNAGLETTTVNILHDKYNIQLFNDMRTNISESIPMLTLLESMGSATMIADAYTWQDEYKGDMMYDVALDDLRLRSAVQTFASGSEASLNSAYGVKVAKLPFATNNVNQIGGKLNFKSVTSVAATSLAITLGTADYGLVTSSKVSIGSETNGVSGVIQGSTDNVAQRFHQILTNLKYTLTEGAVSDVKNGIFSLTFNAANSTPVYMMFDNLVIAETAASNAIIHTYNSVIVLIDSFTYDPATTKMVITLDLSNSNHALFVTNNAAVLYSVPGSSDYFDGNVTTPSRLLFVGQRQSAPLPIAQGDNFSFGGNFNSWREEHSNNSQIFETPKYGLSGTKLNTQFRFGDGMVETRGYYFNEYKKQIDAAFKYGIKSRQRVLSADNSFMENQEVTSVGGLMDYSLFPIKYVKAPLAQASMSTDPATAAATLMAYLDNLGNCLAGFRVNNSEAITLLCSQKMLKKLNPLSRLAMSSAGFMGGNVQITQPSDLSFGLKIYSYETSDGIKINFLHDPSLDFMPSMPIPYVIFGQATIPGRDVMLMLDRNNMKKLTFRADKIEGDLQDKGQDAVLEGMRGEHSFMLRYPKNFAVIWTPDSV